MPLVPAKRLYKMEIVKNKKAWDLLSWLSFSGSDEAF